MTEHVIRNCCFAILMLPTLCLAEGELLLGDAELAAKLEKASDYQVLDARSADAQRSAPIAFSTRYQKVMPINNCLVLIVADTDAAALEIARSIPAHADRNVFAVKGGAKTWQHVSSKTSPQFSMSDSFVIPMNTCEQGKPLQELKRNKPWQEPESK
jgi:hypothetical protein